MHYDLLKKIVPLFDEDYLEYEEIKNDLKNSSYPIIWDASSGLDLYPLIALSTEKITNLLSYHVQNAIWVMSDYQPDYIARLKNIYEKLDNGPVKIFGAYHFNGFSYNRDRNEGRPLNGDVFIDQMIPFKLWGNNERNTFPSKYEYHSSMTNHPVPDADWQIVYFLLRFQLASETLIFPIVFIGAENLLIFEKIFKKYNIPIDLFLAVRVAGKSGSWDYTHDFTKGKLPRAIKEAPMDLRPRYWGLEEVKWGNNIPETFKKVLRIKGLGYGGCTIFQTNWRVPS